MISIDGTMTNNNSVDVIIIGGSYSGLSAALTLGRSLRSVLVIDNGKPCNRQAPHSHNFLTQDGQPPARIAATGREQVTAYDTVTFYTGLAVSGIKTAKGFAVTTQSNDTFTAKKLILATGLNDIMPAIDGFSECWGVSIIHCPYCHGYEVREEKTGIFGNGDIGYHYGQLISNWTKNLVLFTNGKSTLTLEQTAKLAKHNIGIIEAEIAAIAHHDGQITSVVLADQSSVSVKAVYTRPDYVQNSTIPAALGCELTGQGLLKVDAFQRTNVSGVYACGDNSSGRAVSIAISTGCVAGSFANNDLTAEAF